MDRSRYLFVFRCYPDIDHLGPLAYKLLEEGEEVHGLVSPCYDPDGDHHLRFLATYERFHLHRAWPAPAGSGRVARARAAVGRWLRDTLPWSIGFLLRHRIDVVAVEWGDGPRARRRASAGAAVALARRLAGSVRTAGKGVPQQQRSNFVLAAWLIGRPLVCLPHGLSIKLDAIVFGDQAERFEREGTIDWSDRNRFTAYVLNTEHHLRWHLEHAGGDPAVMKNWGSLRWAPDWFEVNRRIAPSFAWPGADGGDLKVILMAPKWFNLASPEAASELVLAMQALDFVSLAVKNHPRLTATDDPLRSDPAIDWARLHDVTAIDSVALIAAADVVIDVGSSIGIEVVMQDKVLVNPAHLHGLKTLFDEIEGSCVRAESAGEVVAYLRDHHAGNPHRVAPEVHAELMRRTVYGGVDEPFDVLGLYASRLRALARDGS